MGRKYLTITYHTLIRVKNSKKGKHMQILGVMYAPGFRRIFDVCFLQKNIQVIGHTSKFKETSTLMTSYNENAAN
jgi:hypothetical protein